jgi:hypothetical protein
MRRSSGEPRTKSSPLPSWNFMLNEGLLPFRDIPVSIAERRPFSAGSSCF